MILSSVHDETGKSTIGTDKTRLPSDRVFTVSRCHDKYHEGCGAQQVPLCCVRIVGRPDGRRSAPARTPLPQHVAASRAYRTKTFDAQVGFPMRGRKRAGLGTGDGERREAGSGGQR